MKKKMLILFITCFIGFFTASNIGSIESSHVIVVVKDRFNNPITWADVSVENMTCWHIGYGYYRGATWPGWHPVYVWGKVYWVDLQPGYNWVYAYL